MPTPAPGPEPVPIRCCDLVMKGGITSGVVYPRAVTEIARSFRLRSIGGTSAGAIAAAAAAAAEFGRLRGMQTGGFRLLERLPEFLGGKLPDGTGNLFALFQPEPGMRPLFRILTAPLNARGKSGALLPMLTAAVRSFPLGSLAGALPGIALGVLAWTSAPGPLRDVSLPLAALLATVGAVAGCAIQATRTAWTRLPAHCFGICFGMGADGGTTTHGHPPALTEWLSRYLNELAGLDPDGPPLTFGQLWDPECPAGTQPTPADPAIRLEMVTSCLSWGRPFRLPFRHDEELRENRFYFRVEEFARLFPEPVVRWLAERPRASNLDGRWIAEGYLPLPDPWNLPVVVATRMSLSFPVLLAAVPLYAYEQEAHGAERAAAPPRRCWFSDGGICSNFPIHFFDSPLPRWPTFAINLFPKPAGTPAETLARPWMPADNR